jgi:CopG family nickel-responsive transcriptional regulator
MASETKTTRFSVSLAEPLLEELDARVIRKGYSTRSEYVRDLIRAQLVAERWEDEEADVVGVLTISYDHHQRGLMKRLMDVQHHAYINVLCTTHVHIDHEHCLEAIILKGRAREIQVLALEIAGLRGVRLAELTRASTLDL